MTTWFTSDTHYYHKSIIGYCNRSLILDESGEIGKMDKFTGTMEQAVESMNNLLIQKWRERVKPEDEVWHLGDFAFCGQQNAIKVLKQLPGRKHWIRGNHDHKLTKQLSQFFESIQDYKLLMHGIIYEDDEGIQNLYKQPIVLFHFPIMSWDGMAHGSWHLHGHCHGSLPDNGSLRLDMGVDCWDYAPVSLEQVQNTMALRTVVPVDHHDARENNPRFKHLLTK